MNKSLLTLALLTGPLSGSARSPFTVDHFTPDPPKPQKKQRKAKRTPAQLKRRAKAKRSR